MYKGLYLDSHPGPCKCSGGGYRKIATQSLRRTPLTCHTLGQTLSLPVVVLSLTDDPSINPAPGASTRKRGAFPLWLTRAPPEQIPQLSGYQLSGASGQLQLHGPDPGHSHLAPGPSGGSDRHTSSPAVGPQLRSAWLQVTQDPALRRGRGAALWAQLVRPPGAACAPQQAAATCAPASRCGLLAPRTPLRGARAPTAHVCGKEGLARPDAASPAPTQTEGCSAHEAP